MKKKMYRCICFITVLFFFNISILEAQDNFLKVNSLSGDSAVSCDSVNVKKRSGAKFERKIPKRISYLRKHYNLPDTVPNSEVFKMRAEEVLTTVFPEEPSLNADSIIRMLDSKPSFGIYKNNFIIAGTTLSGKINRFNSDAKIQISISQRLTNSVLPFKTYLFLTYTQLAFWDIFRESFPFGDINFNPTIGVGRALIYKNRFLGTLALQLEHESNGKDEDYSRSWNKVSFMTLLKLNRHFTVQAKVWIPIIDGENNRDIAKYKGWGHLGIDYNYESKYNIGLLLTKRSTPNLGANITANFALRLFKSDNQYLFVEYYNGYGESLMDYNQYHHRIRAGIVIKPNFLFVY